jgi:proline dehydrogenase
VESVEEQLTRRILKKLNRLGDHSAEFQLVARTYGSSDRLSLAQNMAKRFASAAALRNVTQLALGENMSSVNTFGQDLMDANMASSAANADPMKSGGGAGNA